MSLRPNHRYSQIGLDRLVRLKWLERTAYLVLAGNEAPAMKAALQEELQGAFLSNSTKIRGSLDKTLTILMKIWVRPPRDLHPLQREGLKLLSHLPREDHIAVHWGMAMAVYPFWGAVAAHVGRLLRLQGTAHLYLWAFTSHSACGAYRLVGRGLLARSSQRFGGSGNGP